MKAFTFTLWVVCFLVFYFSFLVLFQYGPARFVYGVQSQLHEIRSLLN